LRRIHSQRRVGRDRDARHQHRGHKVLCGADRLVVVHVAQLVQHRAQQVQLLEIRQRHQPATELRTSQYRENVRQSTHVEAVQRQRRLHLVTHADVLRHRLHARTKLRHARECTRHELVHGVQRVLLEAPVCEEVPHGLDARRALQHAAVAGDVAPARRKLSRQHPLHRIAVERLAVHVS
jgi:hypothetical protein